MNMESILGLCGGLALFLYGMRIMGDGLKQGSGTVLKNVLGKLTQNTFLGVLTGALVTAVIQSSTATIEQQVDELCHACLMDHQRQPFHIPSHQLFGRDEPGQDTAHVRDTILPAADLQFFVDTSLALKRKTAPHAPLRVRPACRQQAAGKKADDAHQNQMAHTPQKFHGISSFSRQYIPPSSTEFQATVNKL